MVGCAISLLIVVRLRWLVVPMEVESCRRGAVGWCHDEAMVDQFTLSVMEAKDGS